MSKRDYQVSVIMPVYNASEFLEVAVASVLMQPEVAELILIEDASSDNSYEVCERLATSDERIVLLTHPDHENRGAGASRNLGLQHARYPYIAFLDADDEYLPDRFVPVWEEFARHPEADGVYASIGAKYYDDTLKDRHLQRVRWEDTGVRKYVVPQDLFRTLATGKFGHLHLDGLVLKRSSIDQTLMFDTSLRQCQDSDLMLRLSTTRKLYPITPDRLVALRGVHPNNRVFNHEEAIHFRKVYLRKCIDQKFYGSQDFAANMYIVTRYIGASRYFQRFKGKKGEIVFKSGFIGLFLLSHPAVAFNLLKVGLKGR